MDIDVFLWDNTNVHHIERHAVQQQEVDELLESRYFTRRTRNGCTMVLGRSLEGRYLAVVVAPRGTGVFYVVTARDMTEAEKRSFRRNR